MLKNGILAVLKKSFPAHFLSKLYADRNIAITFCISIHVIYVYVPSDMKSTNITEDDLSYAKEFLRYASIARKEEMAN
jgi:hypothetical protein